MEERKERIINLLGEHREGLTIEELSSKVQASRHTVSLVLAELKGAERIIIRKVAAAKLHYLK